MNFTAQSLYEEIKQYCIDNASEETVKKYSRYFKDGVYDAWGLTTPLMEAKKEELKQRGVLTIDLIFETAPLLMKSGKYEETSFVLAMLAMESNKFDKTTFNRIEELFRIGILNWAHADHLGMFLLPMFLKKKLVTKDDFRPWVTSEYKFKRRCVPVTYIKLLKELPLKNLLEIVDPLMMDKEREVHQGMGWFLREAWKIHPAETEEYLFKYRDTAPRLIFQYACEKMSAENKQKFRKVKA